MAKVLTELPNVDLAELPRMADFARVLAAMDASIGTHALEHYLGQHERVAKEVVDSDPVAIAIHDLSVWEGTAKQLYDRITPREHSPKGWPSLPRTLVGRLWRLQPALLSLGTRVTIDEALDRNRRVIRIASIDDSSSRSSRSSRSSQYQPTQDFDAQLRAYRDNRRRLHEARERGMAEEANENRRLLHEAREREMAAEHASEGRRT